MKTDIIYYYAVVYILRIIWGFFDSFKKDDVAAIESGNINKLTKQAAKSSKFGLLMILIDSIWIFAGIFATEFWLVFWVILTLNLVYTIFLGTRFIKNDLDNNLLSKMYNMFGLMKIALVGLILYKHFAPIYLN
jgi:cation transport ATPase